MPQHSNPSYQLPSIGDNPSTLLQGTSPGSFAQLSCIDDRSLDSSRHRRPQNPNHNRQYLILSRPPRERLKGVVKVGLVSQWR